MSPHKSHHQPAKMDAHSSHPRDSKGNANAIPRPPTPQPPRRPLNRSDASTLSVSLLRAPPTSAPTSSSIPPSSSSSSSRNPQITPWPGTRGRFIPERRQGYRGLHDSQFPGIAEILDRVWKRELVASPQRASAVTDLPAYSPDESPGDAPVTVEDMERAIEYLRREDATLVAEGRWLREEVERLEARMEGWRREMVEFRERAREMNAGVGEDDEEDRGDYDEWDLLRGEVEEGDNGEDERDRWRGAQGSDRQGGDEGDEAAGKDGGVYMKSSRVAESK